MRIFSLFCNRLSTYRTSIVLLKELNILYQLLYVCIELNFKLIKFIYILRLYLFSLCSFSLILCPKDRPEAPWAPPGRRPQGLALIGIL